MTTLVYVLTQVLPAQRQGVLGTGPRQEETRGQDAARHCLRCVCMYVCLWYVCRCRCVCSVLRQSLCYCTVTASTAHTSLAQTIMCVPALLLQQLHPLLLLSPQWSPRSNQDNNRKLCSLLFEHTRLLRLKVNTLNWPMCLLFLD